MDVHPEVTLLAMALLVMVLIRGRGLVGCRGRQDELELGAVFAVRRRRQLAAMLLDDHAANRQAQSHAVRLRRQERGEYAVQFLRGNSRSGVFYRNRNGIAAPK